ncbi:hypothetical protein QTH91_05840 [Variovorax dokdonensis]|uniref:Phage protein n=1 Tax=Variovorax dokdonensis TaxID=344883 RepID=A0ABT7N7U1_9BURK|nr:hypothetical protein [Variovorax dokdonensis]MDM0043995.1 hypothetical protein [Variovorax dokdonensis]
MPQSTIVEGVEVFDIPKARALAISQEYGPAMSNQKVAALLAASTNLTATQIEALPAMTYSKVCLEVMKRLVKRNEAAQR